MAHEAVGNGMSTDQVAARLGRPPRRARIRPVGAVTDQELWVYADRDVLFDAAGLVLAVVVRRPPTRWVIADGVATAFHAR